jgi:hypothetical protein
VIDFILRWGLHNEIFLVGHGIQVDGVGFGRESGRALLLVA